jgi:FAD/FMN-containing dehydrogenase
VILPRDAADVEAALAACRATGAAVLPRGAGTSLAGQCANVAVVFDFSRYMNKLAPSIPPPSWRASSRASSSTACARPPSSPPDLRSRSRDALPLHPRRHDRQQQLRRPRPDGRQGVDNVESLDLVLYDGTRMTVGRTSARRARSPDPRRRPRRPNLRRPRQLRDRYAAHPRKFPRIPRRVSGYNLDELLDENGFHVARALVGSEGTCATVVSATLNLTASPPFRVLTVLAFTDGLPRRRCRAARSGTRPIGLEGFDGLLVDFMRARSSPWTMSLCFRPARLSAGRDGRMGREEAQAKAEALVRAAQVLARSARRPHLHAADAARIWHVRDSALGATVFVPGEPERHEGWDDAGIPPAQLGAYLRKLTALMAEYGYNSPLYGHYGQGCVHMRINFDFRTVEGVRNFREFIDRAADLVLSFGGSLSGEHGDGQSRAALLPKMFGPELMQAFPRVQGHLGPGQPHESRQALRCRARLRPGENLRHGGGANHRVGGHTKLETHFVFAADGRLAGTRHRALRRRGRLPQHRGRRHVPQLPRHRRGAALHPRPRPPALGDALRRAAQRRLPEQGRPPGPRPLPQLQGLQIRVPGAVDMAAYKSEFLAQRYKHRLHPLHHYIFGFADLLARLGSLPRADQRRAHRPPHQPAHQAHRWRGARAQNAPPGREELQKGA